QQCGTCFQVDEKHYIAPDNLPEYDSEVCEQTWQQAESDIELELNYQFLHDATMRYLLSKIGGVAKSHAYYWRYGCCFFDSKHKVKVWFNCKLIPQSSDAELRNFSQ